MAAEVRPSDYKAARHEAARLMRGYFQDLTERDEAGRPVANVFVMGSAAEILRSFDIGMAFTEIYSLQTAVKGKSMDFIGAAEDHGYSPDICGYVKADIGLHLTGRENHPSGRLPRPALAVAPNTCNTYIKWAEIWEHIYSSPAFILDLPGMRGNRWFAEPGSEQFENDRRYVEGQLRELISLCEQITGQKFEIDRLREIMGLVNTMAGIYTEILELNKARPAPFSALREGTQFMGIANCYRGTQEGIDYFRLARDELAAKVQAGVGSIPDGSPEKNRLLFIGTACYSHFPRFMQLFEEWGGVFVHNEYMTYAGGGIDRGIQYDIAHPLESLAEQMLLTSQRSMSSIFFSQDWQKDVVAAWGIDGICFHGVKSCRTVSTGLADSREFQVNQNGIPGLMIESDLVDPRLWSEAQMKNRIDAFFEALASRKAALGR